MLISKINLNKRFSFCPVPHTEVLKQIKNLDTEKAIRQNGSQQSCESKTPIFFKFLP